MTEETARFALPLLQSGQAQKEVFHNEAVARMDIALHAAVATLATNVPPVDPAAGACWIIGPAPEGAWIGKAGRIAGWTSGGWRFVTPLGGTIVWIADLARWAWHDGDAWRSDALPTAGLSVAGQQVIGVRQPAINDISGGTNVDAEARMAVSSILSTLRVHGLINT